MYMQTNFYFTSHSEVHVLHEIEEYREQTWDICAPHDRRARGSIFTLVLQPVEEQSALYLPCIAAALFANFLYSGLWIQYENACLVVIKLTCKHKHHGF